MGSNWCWSDAASPESSVLWGLRTYHVGHAGGAFLQKVDGSSVELLQDRVPLSEQLVREVAVKQNLLPVAEQSEHRDTHRHLGWDDRRVIRTADGGTTTTT